MVHDRWVSSWQWIRSDCSRAGQWFLKVPSDVSDVKIDHTNSITLLAITSFVKFGLKCLRLQRQVAVKASYPFNRRVLSGTVHWPKPRIWRNVKSSLVRREGLRRKVAERFRTIEQVAGFSRAQAMARQQLCSSQTDVIRCFWKVVKSLSEEEQMLHQKSSYRIES